MGPASKLERLPLDNFGCAWATAVSSEAWDLATACGLQRLVAAGSSSKTLLFKIAYHIWGNLQAAREWCRENVYATGSALELLPPDDRHVVEDKAILAFQFYPEEGRIFAQAPRIESASRLL